MPDQILKMIEASAEFIQNRLRGESNIALVLGSGLGPMVELLENQRVVPYDAIPYFEKSTVAGHAGQLVSGTLNGIQVVCMNGRFHYYEGYTMAKISYPVRVLHRLGVKFLILTNASGGINPSFEAGDLMLVTDHINLMGSNPLIGPNTDKLGPRFPDMTTVYSEELRRKADNISRKLGINIKEGVYAAMPGPNYETPAEVKMLKAIGADAVGMSTVPEAIVARHMGMEVLAISCVTNMAAGISEKSLSHKEVTETANRVKQDYTRLIAGIVDEISN